MKKDDFIKELQNIPGNPEIKLWNGMVSDWMDIDSLVEGDLVKETEAHYLEMCRLEKCVDLSNFGYQFTDDDLTRLRKVYSEHVSWEDNPFVTSEDIDNNRYHIESIYYINAKPRGETFIDRQGSVKY